MRLPPIRAVTRKAVLTGLSSRKYIPRVTWSPTYRDHFLACAPSSNRNVVVGWKGFASSAVPQPPDDDNNSGDGSVIDDSQKSAVAGRESDSFLDKQLRPYEVVSELDRHIVGQQDAKRAVAIAMRNRWRRMQLSDEMRKEVTPRNVLMVGPTGCGKTEVARRMAMLNDAPFLKVEATKFTEVGYHGRDVDQIIRDLMDVSIQLTRRLWTEKLRAKAAAMVEDKILDLLAGPVASTPPPPASSSSSEEESEADDGDDGAAPAKKSSSGSRGRESFRTMLRDGVLDDQVVELSVPKKQMERRKMPVSEARKVIEDMELDKLLETVDIKKEAIAAVEQSGIVFIDEIDKICTPREGLHRSADASAEGVQRDLLPLIEGTTIKTNYGNVNTDYILFVASGAFHAVKPSDLLPELQGRLPIRVELKGLTEEDLYRILTEPVANLVRQQVEMIATEGVQLVFEDDAIRQMAHYAALWNKEIENIGARRLHTVMERVMEELSFQAADKEKGTVLTVNKELVEQRLAEFTKKTDLAKYIL
ncbi:hypothetical protein ACA910_005796 [Epithemia clementina (nom. ined.)]